MALANRNSCSGAAGWIRACLLSGVVISGAVLALNAPARAQEQQDPPQGLINRLLNPRPDTGPAEDPDHPRGLINRFFEPDPVKPVQPAQAAPIQPPAATAAAPAEKKKPKKPVTSAQADAPAAAPVPVQPAPPRERGWFESTTDSMGMTGPTKADTIDYSERPKLKVPEAPVLPPPQPLPEARGARPLENEALTQPKGDYLQKVQGADGKITGFKEGDEGKSKFLNFF